MSEHEIVDVSDAGIDSEFPVVDEFADDEILGEPDMQDDGRRVTVIREDDGVRIDAVRPVHTGVRDTTNL